MSVVVLTTAAACPSLVGLGLLGLLQSAAAAGTHATSPGCITGNAAAVNAALAAAVAGAAPDMEG